MSFFFFLILSLVTLKEEMYLELILFINFDKYHVASREKLLSCVSEIIDGYIL